MSDVQTAVVESGCAFRLSDFVVDPSTGEVRGPQGCEHLDPKVMDVLLALAKRPRQIVPREELMRAVWRRVIVSDDALSRCIYQLRRHLSRAGGSIRYKDLLETHPKRGYRLNAAPEPLPARTEPEPASSPAPSPRPGRYRPRYLGVAAFAVLLAAGLWQLDRADYFWRNPFAHARITRLTDFEGVEEQAAISRDGKFAAFLSDRDGEFDVWLDKIDTGMFRNVTQGKVGELRNPAVRTLQFSPDGSNVILWTRTPSSSAAAALIDLWEAPSAGGGVRPFLGDVAEVDWSLDGTRMVYHKPDSGDPLFVTTPGETVGRQIFAAPPGVHCHFPIWSPDGAFIYFVYGLVPDDLDIWRIAPAGGQPERITFHHSRVAYPVFLNRRTLLYLATAEDGSGPWLHEMNLERRVTHRIGMGLQPLTSLAASADGRRLVATVATQRTDLWRVPILDRIAKRSDARHIELTTRGGLSPRVASNYILYRSLPHDGETRDLWRLDSAGARVLWDGRQGSVVAAAAIDPSGSRVAFPVRRRTSNTLYLMNTDGTAARPLAEELDVRGAPTWSPDGRWVAIGADRGGGPQLFKIPVQGGSPIPVLDKYSIDPSWSPDGRFLVYRGAESGPGFQLQAATTEGRPFPVPKLVLPRGAQRFSFVPAGILSSGTDLVILQGGLQSKDFWLVDLETRNERQLTDFGAEFVIGDFDVSRDGREIVFDRTREQSDIILIRLTD